MRSVTKRSCSKIAGCPAYSCSDDNCLAKKVAGHKAPLREDDKEFTHNRRWYGLARWKKMRKGQLSREPLCQRCLSFDIITAGSDIDHVTPHRGDPKLFFDKENLQTLCRSCHSHKTNEEQKGEYLDYRSVSVRDK